MSDSLPSFPLNCLDIREARYTVDPHYVLVLQGVFSPQEQPIFSLGETTVTPTVDVQGLWGGHEWSLLPQKLDASSPWLALIPIYQDAHHITRSTIHKSMLAQKEKEKGSGMEEKGPMLFSPEEQLKKRIWDYGKELTERAEKTVEQLRGAGSGVEAHIVLPTEAIQRATYLRRLIVAGVPSPNALKRAISSMRRTALELDGFDIWATIMAAPPHERATVSASLRTQKRMAYRGVFLDGTAKEWLDAGSDVRRMYAHMLDLNAPLYALVKQSDWSMSSLHVLRAGSAPFIASAQMQEREKRQLRFYCYPPRVAGSQFERASRGLCEHSEQGQEGEIDRLGHLARQRIVTQMQQTNAVPDPQTGPVGSRNRPNPEWQSFLNSTKPPYFMPFYALSDVSRSGLHALDMKQDTPGGAFIPKPSLIWGLKGPRLLPMLETLAATWKLLLLRPCLYERGDLTEREAFLTKDNWRAILGRVGVNTVQSAMWKEGRRELWGSSLLPSVVQRTQDTRGQPTLNRMDCGMGCSPVGKFSEENDPEQKLCHLLLFRLGELHVLHDFASYHPGLQKLVNGRWCPPAFDAQEALDDRPEAFPGLSLQVSEEESKAIEDILAVARWNGRDGIRGWEMQDGPGYREWLSALRTLLGRCPMAWTDNRFLASSAESHPGLDVLTCDLSKPDAPVKSIAWMLMGTHMLLCMRAGRVPMLWFNKPALMDLSLCNHKGQLAS